jgi:hypothetical protein
MSTSVEIAPFDPTTLWLPVGVSNESVEIVRERAKEYQSDRQTPASFAWRDSLLEQVGEILQGCSDQAWDGYNAEPVSPLSAESALELARNLPAGIQKPTVVPEPDGDISFEWRTDDNRLFSLSVTGPTLVYAGRFGGSLRQYGEERFFGVIPRTIMEILTRYFPVD